MPSLFGIRKLKIRNGDKIWAGNNYPKTIEYMNTFISVYNTYTKYAYKGFPKILKILLENSQS